MVAFLISNYMIYVKSCPAPGTLELFVMLKIQAVKRLVLSIRHSLKNSNLMYDQSEKRSHDTLSNY